MKGLFNHKIIIYFITKNYNYELDETIIRACWWVIDSIVLADLANSFVNDAFSLIIDSFNVF